MPIIRLASYRLASFVLAAALVAPALTVLPVAAGELPEAEYPKTRGLIELVDRAAELVEERGLAACDALKEKDGEFFHDDVYVFLLEPSGTMRCHPTQPSLEGHDTLDIEDPDGRPILELMLRQLRGADRGFTHYLWPRPETGVHTWKSTYLRRARTQDGGELIVGSGVYDLPLEKIFVVDRVNEAVRLLERHGKGAFDILRGPSGGFRFFDAYVFVMSTDGVMLVHPASPELEGQAVLELRDAEGTSPGHEMLRVIEEGEAGWVDYYWPRPGEGDQTLKETYVRRVEVDGEILVVGAGVYLE